MYLMCSSTFPLEYTSSFVFMYVTSLPAGFPPPRITWSRRGAALPANHVVSDGILEIPRVSLQDAGEYVCTGQNVAGSFHVTVQLRVQGQLYTTFN